MKLYEIVYEIFNECANNQMRDIFFEEVQVEDTDLYVRTKIKDPTMTYEKSVKEDGTIIYDIVASGMKQRCSFTEL